MNNKGQKVYKKPQPIKTSFSFGKFLVATLVYIVYVLLFMSYIKNANMLVDSSFKFRVGELCPSDIVARKNVKFIDKYATNKAREQAALDAPSVYVRDDSKLRRSVFLLNIDKTYDATNIENYNRLELILNDVCKKGFFDINELKKDKNKKIEFEGVLYDKESLLTASNLHLYIYNKYRDSEDGYTNYRNENFVFNSVMRYLSPNAVYNIFESTYREQKARESVEPVVVDIKKGDIVVAKDEIITEQKYQILVNLSVKESQYSNTTILICLLLGFAYLVGAFYFLYTIELIDIKFHSNQYYFLVLFYEAFFFALSILVFYLELNFGLGFLGCLSFQCLPCFCVFSLTKSRRIAYAIFGLNMLLFLQIPLIQWQILLRSSIVTSIIIEMLMVEHKKFKLSKKVALASFLSFVVSFLIDYSSLRLPLLIAFEDSVAELFKLLICSGICKLFILIAENTFNLPTKRMLNRLILLDSSLIDRFKSLCPGSFEHSEVVMDIAENAAEKIGANVLLVKAAARFHDIGKMEHPEYFIENQRSNISRHQMLKNSLSGAIIRSHVPLGVNLLKQNNFPQEVIELVNEHHGNDVITYFYLNAQKEAEEGEQVLKSDFSYQSNPPSTKESGILMLSDVCEAATRSRKEYQDFKELGDFVHNLIQGKIAAGQLDNSTITIGELSLIEESIISTLKSKLHKRIKYPDAKQEIK